MSHVPHELHDEFPADTALLHALKLNDPHFQQLAEQYHVLNRSIHRAETEVEPASDAYIEDLKKQRLAALDAVSAMLAKARATA